jgi:hypothetical protein
MKSRRKRAKAKTASRVRRRRTKDSADRHVHPDCEGGSHSFVEWGDRDSACYVTVFDGPMAEQRACEYFDALKAGRLRVLREIE